MEEKLDLWWNFQFGAQDAKCKNLNILVNVCFSSLFGAKRNYTSPTNSESAKDLVRISLLEEKLDIWGKLQFGAQDAKFKISIFSLMVAFPHFLEQRQLY